MSQRLTVKTAIVAVIILAALSGASLRSQQRTKMDSLDLERSRGILRDAYENVKKHYYDPKYHGLNIDARYHDFDAKIQNASSLGQAFGLVAGYLDGLNDSHTFFNPPARPFRFDYGYRMQIFGDDCFITRVRPGTDAESKIHPGDQVISYNRFSVNREDFWKMEYYFDALSPQKASLLDLRDTLGQARTINIDSKIRELKKVVDVTGADGGSDIWQLIRDMENSDHVVRQRYYEMGDVMIWKMPEFDLDEDHVDHMFGIVRKHKSLILDLRGNPGGSILTLERMLGNVLDHDLKVADRIGRKEMKPEMAKTRGANAFSGKLIVLVDSDSASAAELFPRVIQLEHRGVVVGDRTMGAVMEARDYSASQGMDTKIFYGFSITEADLIMKDGKSLEHVGVTPDEILIPSAKDLGSGSDPVLSRAAELAGLNIEPAAAGKLFPFEWLPN
ncbi:MAG TPA: S41 family peptidase [Candidatus Sulfotelmatobacter sp.]|nr:S41 family peptidase [Candidatus Sulfotelmatobacter sp.]